MVLDDLGDVMDDVALGDSGIIGCGTHHKQRPAQHTHQQGNGCLVDSGQTFKGYAEVADAEDDDNCNRKC